MVQWLRLGPPNAGSLGSAPGQGTRSCMPQIKILCATTKTQHSQIKKLKKKKKKKKTITKMLTILELEFLSPSLGFSVFSKWSDNKDILPR